ncbi:MAG: J domain-containing protein [bacterium]|nr:J domain-containing protein [bacterium]
MALKRPALAILGISLNFARAHPKEIIVAVADAIYRTAASKYHPDKGADAVPLPDGVNLTELQEARDAVRANPAACIKEIGRGEQTSRDGKRAGEFAERISVLEEMDVACTQNLTALWDLIARQKLGLKIKEEKMEEDSAVAYSTLHLNGVAILVASNEERSGGFYEYLRHNDTWFKRSMTRASFSKNSPCPPGIPPELILEGSGGSDRGNFYDQSGPHVVPEGFEILGSYRKADLAKAREEKRKAKGKKSAEGESPTVSGGWSLRLATPGLDPLVASVLVPSVSVGAVLQTVLRGAEESVQYSAQGVIVGIRVFDQKQRP